MSHGRHYTVEEANAELEWVVECLRAMREARDKLTDQEAREALAKAAPANGGGAPGRVVSEGFLTLRATLGELEARDVVLRDLDRGLVDFPALRNGREVYLCWVEGEERIEYWHEPEAGFAGREPL